MVGIWKPNLDKMHNYCLCSHIQEKQNLVDIIQTQYQLKARQLAMQSDTNSVTAYPEYILAYLVHALAHHSCPNVDECKDIKAYEDIYR